MIDTLTAKASTARRTGVREWATDRTSQTTTTTMSRPDRTIRIAASVRPSEWIGNVQYRTSTTENATTVRMVPHRRSRRSCRRDSVRAVAGRSASVTKFGGEEFERRLGLGALIARDLDADALEVGAQRLRRLDALAG